MKLIRVKFEELVKEENYATGGASLSYEKMQSLLEMHVGLVDNINIIKKLDTNKDNKISFDEFTAALIGASEERDDEILESTFKMLDFSGNGLINATEIRQVLTNYSGEKIQSLKLDEQFKREIDNFVETYDADGDDKLNLEEFKQAFKRFAIHNNHGASPDDARLDEDKLDDVQSPRSWDDGQN